MNPAASSLNSIEPAFAKGKQALRSAAHRTADALRWSMQGLLDRVTASDADAALREDAMGKLKPLEQ